jgi:hypothetical protein
MASAQSKNKMPKSASAKALKDSRSGIPSFDESFFAALSNSTRAPVEVPENRRSKLLVSALVGAMSGVKKASPKILADGFLLDAKAANDLLFKKKEILFKAIEGMGTHVAKIPDNTVEMGVMTADDVSVVTGPGYLDGSSVRISRALTGAGNAGWTSAYRLLSTTVRIDGETITVADVLIHHGNMLSAFADGLSAVSLGILREVGVALSEARRNRPTGIDAGQKILLFPIGPDRYRAVTPLVSAGLVGELTRRIWDRRSAGQRVITETVYIGGTQPQNSGLLVSDLGGRLSRFWSVPPQNDRSVSEIMLQSLLRGTFHPVQEQLPRVVIGVYRAAKVHYDARGSVLETRQRYQEASRFLIRAVLRPLRRLRRIVVARTAEDGPLPIAMIPERMRPYARAIGIGKALDTPEIEILATEVVRTARKVLAAQSPVIVVDDRMQAELLGQARIVIEGLR